MSADSFFEKTEEYDGRIILVATNKDGCENARLDFNFSLANPPGEDVISSFQKAFYKTFSEDHVFFECMAVYVPFQMGFHWDCIKGIQNPREFFIEKCLCLTESK